MARGRKPEPRETLKLRGSSAIWKPRHRRKSPAAPIGTISCPACLDTEAKAEWKRVTRALRDMKMLKSCDRAMLAGLCVNWSLFYRCTKELNKQPIDGTADQRRMATTASDAFKNYVRACEQFGLSPSARTRIDVREPGKDEDAFEAFLGSTG